MENNTPTFLKIANFIGNTVTKIKDYLGNLSAGWKSALKALAACVGIAYLIDKIGVDRVKKVKESLAAMDSPGMTAMKSAFAELKDIVSDGFMDSLKDKFKELVGATLSPILSEIGNKIEPPEGTDEEEVNIDESVYVGVPLTEARVRSIIRSELRRRINYG